MGDNGGGITTSYSTAKGTGNEDVGGLVGCNDGTISTSYSTGSVSGNEDVGGLVGSNDGTITTSYSTGTVSGGGPVGGLVGRNAGGITTSYSTGAVSGEGAVGGLAGINSDSISTSYSTGEVNAVWSIGGLVGGNYFGLVSNCYSAGTATGNLYVGGLVGTNYGSIAASYSTAKVAGNDDVGGLVGENRGASITASFWDIQTSDRTNMCGSGDPTWASGCDNAYGKTTAEMQMESTFTEAGWDFVDETINGTCDYWQMSPGDYPRLRYHSGESPVMPEGLGTAEEPYLIRDALGLGTMWFEPMAHYSLEAPLDLSGTTWSMGVIPWFGGSFDGNGRVISNLHIQGGGYLGLFGRLRSGALISNLGLEAARIDGTGDHIGCLVGANDGSITRSYSTGTVSGRIAAGGLVGQNGSGCITSSYSTSAVSANIAVGGLVGYNVFGCMANSYSTGSVSGGDYLGGLVGQIWSGGPIHASFWDMETSGLVSSYAGSGKTTAEMQTESTFTDAGWDFVGESINGTEDIWSICEGQDYPKLTWQFVVGDFDGDIDIDFEDFCILAERWLRPDRSFWWCRGTDLTNDALVNWQDLMVFTENWSR